MIQPNPIREGNSISIKDMPSPADPSESLSTVQFSPAQVPHYHYTMIRYIDHSVFIRPQIEPLLIAQDNLTPIYFSIHQFHFI